ncbi:hypothetical protein [Steroidobacter cummioxidans]|uniref:hypothetical protein n=1 Tax=Steroidobacter cummioxidans TaxID=1803913 RepID=UPI00129043F0|nr:hypothetical protein [Steroidobacter cummioxidans]
MKRSIELIGLALLSLLTGCANGPSEPSKGTEIASVAAPDGFARAFVFVPELAGGLGATISQPYQVWMESLKIGTDKQLMLEADKTDGFHLSWNSAGQLVVCYADAQIYKFRNQMVMVVESSPQMHVVEVLLKRADKIEDCQVR